MKEINDMLAEREQTHGEFPVFAHTALAAADVFRKVSRVERPEQVVAFQMILVKLARIAAGDPEEADHWHDIAGYAMLAAKSIPPKPGR